MDSSIMSTSKFESSLDYISVMWEPFRITGIWPTVTKVGNILTIVLRLILQVRREHVLRKACAYLRERRTRRGVLSTVNSLNIQRNVVVAYWIARRYWGFWVVFYTLFNMLSMSSAFFALVAPFAFAGYNTFKANTAIQNRSIRPCAAHSHTPPNLPNPFSSVFQYVHPCQSHPLVSLKGYRQCGMTPLRGND